MVRLTKDEMIAELRMKLRTTLTQITSDYSAPVPLPSTANYINGWTCNVYSNTVIKACRVGHLYARECHYDPKQGRLTSGSQNGFPIYATERDAWIALRLQVESEVKSLLAGMDMRIEELEKVPHNARCSSGG